MASHEFVRSKRELISLLSTDGSAGKALHETNIHHVPWMFSNIPVDCCSVCTPENNNNDSLCVSNSSQIENNSDDETTQDSIQECIEQTQVNITTVNELTLRPSIENVVGDVDNYDCEAVVADTGVVLDDDEDEEDDEEFVAVHTFLETDNTSMKIISFPDMKKTLETNLCCMICFKERHKGDICLYQKTYKLATVLTIVCKYGHKFHIRPEKIDNNRSDSSDNFKINIFSFLQCSCLEKDCVQCASSLDYLESKSWKEITKFGKKYKTKLVSHNKR